MKHWLWVALLACGVAWGTGNDIEASASSGDAIVGGSDAVAFGHALGDVDINQCMASTQWGTILVSKQRVVLNKWCAAEVYDAKGLHQMAALMRCDIDEVAKHFPTHIECTTANTAAVIQPASAQDNRTEESDERHLEQQMMYVELEQKITDLEAQLNKPKPVRAPVAKQRPLLSKEQAEELRVKK